MVAVGTYTLYAVFECCRPNEASVFETTIRIVGGMLSAYELTQDAMYIQRCRHPSQTTAGGLSEHVYMHAWDTLCLPCVFTLAIYPSGEQNAKCIQCRLSQCQTEAGRQVVCTVLLESGTSPAQQQLNPAAGICSLGAPAFAFCYRQVVLHLARTCLC